jgi:hypothetical protein
MTVSEKPDTAVTTGNRVNEVTQNPSSDENVLDIRFLVVEVLKKWWLLLICVTIGIYLGIQDMHGFGSPYVAKMVVSPIGAKKVQGSPGGDILGVLAGLNIGESEEITKFDRLVYLVSTISFARKMDEKHQMMMEVFGGGFDKETNTWIKPKGREFEIREKINRFLNLGTWMPPSIENLAGFIGGSIQVTESKDNPFMTVSFTHGDPKEAVRLLKLIYSEAEALIRQQDIEEQKKRRNFLEERYAETQIAEFRQALTDMISQLAREEMMSHKDLPSIARIIEPPFVSKFKPKPDMVRTLGVRIVGALGAALAMILFLVLLKRE